MNRRSGFSLIELLVVITVGCSLLFLGIELVHRAMHLQKLSDTDLNQMRSLNRLADQFRIDAHRAVLVKDVATDSFTLNYADESGSVNYRFLETKVRRVEMNIGSRDRLEDYPLTPGTRIQVALMDAPKRIRMTVYRPATFEKQPLLIDRDLISVIGTLPAWTPNAAGGAP